MRDAEALATLGSWRNAYILAGHAVEFALKGRTMRHLGLHRWPTRREEPEFYTHDIEKLARLAGLLALLDDAIGRADPVGSMWMIVQDFDIKLRYPDGRPFSARHGRQMVQAASGPQGIVRWIIRS